MTLKQYLTATLKLSNDSISGSMYKVKNDGSIMRALGNEGNSTWLNSDINEDVIGDIIKDCYIMEVNNSPLDITNCDVDVQTDLSAVTPVEDNTRRFDYLLTVIITHNNAKYEASISNMILKQYPSLCTFEVIRNDTNYTVSGAALTYTAHGDPDYLNRLLVWDKSGTDKDKLNKGILNYFQFKYNSQQVAGEIDGVKIEVTQSDRPEAKIVHARVKIIKPGILFWDYVDLEILFKPYSGWEYNNSSYSKTQP